MPYRTGFTLLATALAIAASATVAVAQPPDPTESTGSTSASTRETQPELPGVVDAGDSKTACIYLHGYLAGNNNLSAVEQAVGIDYNCIETFSDADPTWADWVDPWLTKNGYGFNTWLADQPDNRTIILTQNLIPNSEASDPNWRAACAAGDFDGYARTLATNLVQRGFGHSVIRLGAEMNGDWRIDNIGNSPTDYHDWAACYAQLVTAMRSVPGQSLLFDWNVNAGYRNIPLADFYPGDQFVDIVGVDAYDSTGAAVPAAPTSSRFAALASQPIGIGDVLDFAKEHGKPLSIPEWGDMSSAKLGAGDDAAYVQGMFDLVRDDDVAYESWYDAGDSGVYQLEAGQVPQSLVAYRTSVLTANAASTSPTPPSLRDPATGAAVSPSKPTPTSISCRSKRVSKHRPKARLHKQTARRLKPGSRESHRRQPARGADRRTSNVRRSICSWE